MPAQPTASTDKTLLLTPPLPANLPKIELTANARQVLMRRYVRRGADGQPIESVEEMFWRVAWHVAKVEETWQGDVMARAIEFYHLLTGKKFFPNSPTFTGAGTPLGQLAACFHPDQPVFTAEGVKRIADIDVGDLVLTHTGSFATVTEVMTRHSNELLKISVSKLPKSTLTVTPEHPILALRKPDRNTDAKPEWIPAGQLQVGDYVALCVSSAIHDVKEINLLDILEADRYEARDGLIYRKNRILTTSGYVRQDGTMALKRRADVGPLSKQVKPLPQIVQVDKDLLRLFGYYVSEGNASLRDNNVQFTFSKDEERYVRDVQRIMTEKFGLEIQPEPAGKGRHWISLRYHSAILAEVFHTLFGSTFDTKIIPRWLLELPHEKQKEFLIGVVRGDSTTFQSRYNSQTRIVMSNPSLVYGVWQIAMRLGMNTALGLPTMPSLATAQPYSCTLSGIKASEFASEALGKSISHNGHKWSRTLLREGYFLNPITGLDKIPFEGTVYNLEVEKDHSYAANMVAAHNCFVLPITDDMGRDSAGIFQTLRDAALIQQTGGGNGFSFSRLRPKGALVKSSAGQATGPVGFLRVYDHAFGEIAQGGTRRGANMAVLRVDHPDIEEFITCKTDENQITNFNISVGITDAFMQAVKEDADWELRFPDVYDPKYREYGKGTLEQAEAAGVPIRVYKKVRARELFQKIVAQAHHNGEPGVLFLDAANRSNPVPHLYPLEATNPCGEQWLGPYENCCLGSVNLNEHCGPNGSVDWETLRQSVATATRFLDDVVEANAYVPAVPQLKEAAHRARRIGLGIMGLADLMYHVGVRYGSPEGQEFGAQVMEFIRYHAMLTSIELAKERGPFPAIQGSIYDMDDLQWQPPRPLTPYQHNWDRPEVRWDAVTEGLQKHGIRNAAQTTVAPTGTIATVAGCEGYGCEPVFALAYIRHVNDKGKDLQLTYASPRFEAALKQAGLGEEKRQEIFEQVMREGTCQNIPEVPENIRNTFVVSADISAEEHVRMQAALQAFVDNSMSKTINFPETATVDDVAQAYLLAWELGCKGITVYVTGSREKVVLETKATAEKKASAAPPTPPGAVSSPQEASAIATGASPETTLWHGSKKPRPRALLGRTYSVETPLGKAFITVNENGGDQPFEVFINTAKAGSETAAVSEAIGRLISYILRLASPIAPLDRMREIVRQLSGIGGGRSLGFGPNRVRSLPDGVGQVIEMYLREKEGMRELPAAEKAPSNGGHLLEKEAEAAAPTPRIGDLCPECGEAAVVNEEGCRKCYACGYSEC